MKTIVTLITLLLLIAPGSAFPWACQPTPPDAQGPYYREGSPVRNSVGKGYLLLGQVKSAADCGAIANAKIELWLAGPTNRYADRWRATVFADAAGRYWFETDAPGEYGSRPPHVHIIVTAPGFHELVTQHYPTAGAGEGLFDLVLLPAVKQ